MNKPRYTNDRKAPRMKKAQFTKKVIDRHMWNEFKAKYPEYKTLKYAELNKVWDQIAAVLREEVVKNPLGVKLASYTGELKLQYLPHKFESISHAATQQQGEPVKNLNIMTRGKVAKLKWERRWAVKFNRMLQFFAFEGHRAMRNASGEHISENPDSLRVSRNTLGGYSFWRSAKNK